MPTSHRFAVCNELFGQLTLEQTCREINSAGYTGIEIAPFTLSDNAVTLTTEDRTRIRNIIICSGLTFVGLHWLLVSPKGLHATTVDTALRRKTWEFIDGLVDLCGDLSNPPGTGDTVMVFGSPQQRSAGTDTTASEAAAILKEELARIAPHAATRRVQLLLEPLSRNQTNVVNTLAEAVEIVRAIGSPAVQTMFDVHNAVDEHENHLQLLEHYAPYIRHVHVNELDGREPGTGDYDFGSLLSTLTQSDYRGWVSLEVFDFTRNGTEIARNALQHLSSVR